MYGTKQGNKIALELNLLSELAALRGAHEDGLIRRIIWVDTKSMIADTWTKILGLDEDNMLRKVLDGFWPEVHNWAIVPPVHVAAAIWGY